MANAGVLLTQVQVIKSNGDKNFAIVDAAMNDMLRPALYNAWMALSPTDKRSDITTTSYDVVGPVCETGDFLGKDRTLAITEGDYLFLSSAGAYGFTMSSNYNSRPKVAEVMVDADQLYLIRSRETIEDLVRGEQLIAELWGALKDAVKIYKMHGLGNDFVLIDAVKQNIVVTSQLAKRLGDRHLGIGCDQILVLEPPSTKHVDFDYRIFNADGTEVEQCNGARCLGRYIFDQRLSGKKSLLLKTQNRVMEIQSRPNELDQRQYVCTPFEPAQIPFHADGQQILYSIEADGNAEYISFIHGKSPRSDSSGGYKYSTSGNSGSTIATACEFSREC